MNNKTIDYYNLHAAAYVTGTENADMCGFHKRFLWYLPSEGTNLDAGCGRGRDMVAFRDAGFSVSGFDASAELCRIATEKIGIPVRQMRFENLAGETEYDGIWACASLLHVARTDLPDVLLRIYRLLKTYGILYASYKYGNGERVKEGRYFCDFTEESCRILMEQAGFEVKEIFVPVTSGKDAEMRSGLM